MSKIKIYELAKELDKPSKELVEFLNKKDVEAKTHMSTIDEAEADMVRKGRAVRFVWLYPEWTQRSKR